MNPTDFNHRFPTLSEHGRAMLTFLSEHPAAPIYRNDSGNKLTPDDIANMHAFEEEVANSSLGWPPHQQPAWLGDFIANTFREVPYYRRLGAAPRNWLDIAPISRADFAADISQFVPDSVPVERLINFRTTGTTGNPLLLASHPVVAARYLTFHKKALQHYGVVPCYGRGKVGVVLVGYQQQCFTYVSVTPTMDESGLAKINLHPNDWRKPEDRATYLNALAPEIYSGDPLSLSELMTLELHHQPKALLSVGMALTPAFKQALCTKFGCPVVDIYSLNEAGPVAVFDSELQGYQLLQPKLFIEILDPQGKPLAPGERGEITLTGGFNFCLPLLRYRTGDFASLQHTAAGPVLKNLEGRSPTQFRSANGQWFNNIDITHALKELPLAQYGLHQHSDGSFTLRLAKSAMAYAAPAIAALNALLGTTHIAVQPIASLGKIVQYSTDLTSPLDQ